MCLTCGCGSPDDDHGEPKNITKEDLEAAAEAAGISVEDAIANLEEAVEAGFEEEDYDEFAGTYDE